jgi:hypothetical protein
MGVAGLNPPKSPLQGLSLILLILPVNGRVASKQETDQMKKNQHHVSETERQKAHAIAQAIGGSKARAARLEITILAVLTTFGGTITHTEKAAPRGYPAADYTQDPETLSAQ